MATYKLIQDIEAEDHILGPLSFRQFVFGLIAAFMGYMCFIVVVKHVPFLLVIFLPPALFCAFFAFPFGGDQPTETWALAKLRFFFLPRKRLWNQSGIKELVTITVPKKIERVYSDGLSQSEVKSRLQALANTIDSRGWAIKHINALGYIPQASDSERLIDIPNLPGEVPGDSTAVDMMDADHNPVAQQFESMITQSTQDRRQRLIDEFQKPLTPEETAASNSQWFMNHNPAATASAGASGTATVHAADDDAALGSRLKQQAAQNQAYGNLRTLQPLGAKTAAAAAAAAAADDTSGPMTAGGDPAILSLSKNNDLNVATLAREAQRAKDEGGTREETVAPPVPAAAPEVQAVQPAEEEHEAQDEVVISLH